MNHGAAARMLGPAAGAFPGTPDVCRPPRQARSSPTSGRRDSVARRHGSKISPLDPRASTDDERTAPARHHPGPGDLVGEGLLQSEGATRATQYSFPGESPLATGDLLVIEPHPSPSSVSRSPSSVIKPSNSVIKVPGPGIKTQSPATRKSNSVIKTPSSVSKRPSSVSKPHSRDIPRSEWTALLERAESIRSSARAEPTKVAAAILAACRGRYLSRQDLAILLGRSQEGLRLKYLNRLVKSGALELEFPAARNHPHQRYRTAAPIRRKSRASSK